MSASPILVVEGLAKERLSRVRVYAIVGVIAVLGGTLLLAAFGYAPWLDQFYIWRPKGSRVRILLRVILVLAIVGAYVADRFLRPKSGKVSFFEDRIVFAKQRSKLRFSWLTGAWSDLVDHEVVVPWGEVVAFRDDSADYVRLVRREQGSSFLTIPTLAEKDRVAVLDLLIARGVPRQE